MFWPCKSGAPGAHQPGIETLRRRTGRCHAVRPWGPAWSQRPRFDCPHEAAQALALFDGLDFVTPEQIQELAVPVIAHRLVLEPQARFSGLTAQGIVEDIVKRIAVPGMITLSDHFDTLFRSLFFLILILILISDRRDR